ncbi:MAG TPA: response regulator, partial [Burkholderiales bacterium]|nr:response regulator [Burkholderiales bacterium]
GSEFVVRLPLGAAQAPARQGPAEAPAAHGGKRILVVDDNGDVTSSVRRLLELAGHDVREARDGLEGVLAATEFDPQIVLLDIGMPRMNGYDAAREIRKRAPGTPPLILAMTGWGQDADKERAREAGFDGHLVKPVDPALLLQVVGA